VYLEPGEQAGDGQDPVDSALRSGQGKAAVLRADLLAVPDQDTEASTPDERKASEVSDAPRPSPPPDVTEIRPQSRHGREVQFTAQAHHAYVAAIMS
jgi:hypothetical protein